MNPCTHCGGTGDKFDDETQDWADPWEDCDGCNGTGEVDGDGNAY